MAISAGADNRIMVHISQWLPVRIRMTFIANKVRLDMIRRHLVCRQQAALVVTSDARNRCPLKQATQMTTRTDCVFMGTFKWESCRKMVESGIGIQCPDAGWLQQQEAGKQEYNDRKQV